MEIDWPYVRQIILNDRLNGYKPDRDCIKKILRVLPGSNILGFGKYYEYHWYVIVESKIFPYSIEPITSRGAIPMTSIFSYIPKPVETA